MLELLKQPFVFIPLIIMIVACAVSFIYPGWIFVISLVAIVLVFLSAKEAGSGALALLPMSVMACFAAIFSGIVLLTKFFS